MSKKMALAGQIALALSAMASAPAYAQKVIVTCDPRSVSIAASDALARDMVAGRPHEFTATAWVGSPGGGCLVDSAYSGTKPFDAWLSLSAEHPAGAAAPSISTDGCATSQPLGSSAPAVDSGNHGTALHFESGVAKFWLCPTDVGRYAVNLRDDTGWEGVDSFGGVSQDVASRPFALWVHEGVDTTTVSNSSKSNPGTTATEGINYFTSAGMPFAVKVAAKAWREGQDSVQAGRPDAGVDLTGNRTLSNFAAAATIAPIAGSQTPVGGVVGAMTGKTALTAADFSDGVANPSVAYLEAGSIRLGASASNYLGMATVPAAASGIYGRFFPHHWVASAMSVKAGCSSGTSAMTYMGQPFGVNATVTAVSKEMTTTRNYDGALGHAFLGYPKFAVNNTVANTNLAARLSISTEDLAWSQGVLKYVNHPITFNRPASGFDGPYEQLQLMFLARKLVVGEEPIFVGQNGMFTGGACPSSPLCNAIKIGATTRMRYGRVTMTNAYGAVVPALKSTIAAEYWEASSWRPNTLDSCTNIPSSSMTTGAWSGITSTSTNYGSPTMSQGKMMVTVTRFSGGPKTGSVLMGINLSGTRQPPGSCGGSFVFSVDGANLPWLITNQCGTTNKSPNAKFIWGSANTRNNAVIFMREAY